MAMEGWTPRRHRFWLRAEIEVDRGSSIPRGPGFGFAAVVREPLVKLRRPQYDFEGWDWDYFSWPHDRLDANLEMRDSDPEATLEADRKASERFLDQSTLQLESHEMYPHTEQRRHAAAWPCSHLETNFDMRDDPEALDAELKASENFLNQSTLQLESCEMYQHAQHQQEDWPCNHLESKHQALKLLVDANLEMRDSDLEATLEADQKAIESFLNQSMLQPESYEMNQHKQEQHTAALPCDHLKGNLETRNTEAEAKLQADRKTKERSMRQRRKRSEMDRRTQEEQHEKENKEAVKFRTLTPLNKKAVGPRSARRRRVFAEANPSLDNDRARQVPWAC